MSAAESSKQQQISERFEALQEIAVELMQTHDPHILLELIVNKALKLMVCDGGSLFLKHSDTEMIFEVALNHTIDFNFEKRVIPVSNNGIAAHCYKTSTPLNIKDVYEIKKDEEYSFNKSFDESVKYRTRSMITQPLVSSKGETLGVLQLVNRKHQNGETWPSQDEKAIAEMPEFTKEDQKLLRSFASLASASIENVKLYESIEALFEGFVKASVDAIETRDPPTRGHSERVALLSCDLADMVSRSQDSDVKKIRFDENQMAELRYAALLHDFGKIGIKESTLLKEEKLLPHQKDLIENRFREFVNATELKLLKDLIFDLQNENRAPTSFDIKKVEDQFQKFKAEIEDHWKLVLQVNRPTVLDEDTSERLQNIKETTYRNFEGNNVKLLESLELQTLSIKRGSLSMDERAEIEEHVTHTYHFLKKIPWTKEYASIPEIAYAHHEKLDSTGYPRRVPNKKIPDQSKIMTICDIYDALVASDRPYKKALPVEKALQILQYEVNDGKLDPRFYKVFLDAKVYENERFQSLMQPSQARIASKKKKKDEAA